MKALITSLLFVTFVCLNITAQSNYYQSFDYMKVEPGNQEDYLALEKAWKKIHEHNLKSGKISGWEFSKILSPIGSSSEYNFVTRTTLKAGEQFETFMEFFPMPEDLSTILSPSELELVNRTGELRTYVKNEIYETVDMVLSENYRSAKIHVFNFFDHPESGSRSAHVDVETELWKPVHQARVEDNKLAGWVFANLVLPFGAHQTYHEVTLDMYTDMSQFMADKSFVTYFERVHPNKDLDALMKQTSDAATLIKGELRMVIDKVLPPVNEN